MKRVPVIKKFGDMWSNCSALVNERENSWAANRALSQRASCRRS